MFGTAIARTVAATARQNRSSTIVYPVCSRSLLIAMRQDRARRLPGPRASSLFAGDPFWLRGNRNLRFQFEKAFLADALYVHELFDFLERTFLRAVVDDASRSRRAHA